MRRTDLMMAVAALAISLPAAARAQGLDDKYTHFGAFAAPAVLPAGASSAYGYAGVPEVGAGYRQGAGPVELEARAYFNYFQVGLGVDAFVKYAAYTDGPLQLAPKLGLGLTWDTGAQYIDKQNYQHLGLRVIPGATLSYRVADTASVLGELTLPMDFSLAPLRGGFWFTPLLGGGGELYLGDDITACAIAQVGADVVKEPLRGVADGRFAFSLKIGLGYRFF